MNDAKSLLSAVAWSFLVLIGIGACSQSQKENSEEEYVQEDYIEEDYEEEAYGDYDEENYGTYELTFRGQRDEWPAERVYFSLHQLPLDKDGMYSVAISMSLDGSDSQSTTADFTLYTDQEITKDQAPKTYNLVHVALFAEDMDCLDNPGGCIGVGTGLIGGTEPKGGMNSGAGMDNDIHTQGGTLTITKLSITKDEDGIIEGLVSGHFELNGINTNASKPNPGEASGKFTDAPFSTLKL